MSRKELLKKLPGRTDTGLKDLIRRLGLAHSQKLWTPEEIEIVRNRDPRMSRKELLKKLPGRSVEKIGDLISRLGLARLKRWTPEEIEIVRNRDLDMPVEEIAKKLPGRTKRSVFGIVNRKGLEKAVKIWSDKEADTLKRYWQKVSKAQLMRMIPGRDWNAIATKAISLGLPTIPDGYDYVFSLTRHLGLDYDTVVKILDLYKIPKVELYPTRNFPSTKSTTTATRRFVASVPLALGAKALYERDITLKSAAKLLGFNAGGLRQKALKAGYDTRPNKNLHFTYLKADPYFWEAIWKNSPMISVAEASKQITGDSPYLSSYDIRVHLDYAGIPISTRGEIPLMVLNDLPEIIDYRQSISSIPVIPLPSSSEYEKDPSADLREYYENAKKAYDASWYHIAEKNSIRTMQKLKSLAGTKYDPAYSIQWNRFVDFCEKMGYPALPTSQEAVSDFIAYLSDRRISDEVINLAFAAIRRAHELSGVPYQIG